MLDYHIADGYNVSF